jgi:hypothetical protein
MKLTKDQRHTAYIIMLAEYETNSEMRAQGFCWLIKELFTEMGMMGCWETGKTIKWFPELAKRKPRKYATIWGLWFLNDKEGMERRRVILRQCINETA